ncbi:MAG TPA: hypothetical protein VNO33_15565 [Kofleriaceae bacterium]|nr:hypothetical protein [Kofleriaceae bacterium]
MWRRAVGWPLRTAALGVALVAVFTALGEAGGARARAEMLEVGADMLRIPEGATPGEAVLFNGAELKVRRGSTPRSLDELLAAAEASCAAPGTDAAARGAALRGGDEQRGFVACVDPSLDPDRGLIDRLRGDQAMALPVAYFYAERRGATTHFIGFDSAAQVDLRAMFPRGGDAPGRDPAALPRPQSSRRALSMRVAGQPYEAVVYLDGERGLDELVAHYQGALPGAGWKTVAPWKVDEGPGPRQASVFVERAGVLALLLVARDRAETTTTFLTMEANREQ